jgi:hypothetical protein
LPLIVTARGTLITIAPARPLPSASISACVLSVKAVSPPVPVIVMLPAFPVSPAPPPLELEMIAGLLPQSPLPIMTCPPTLIVMLPPFPPATVFSASS